MKRIIFTLTLVIAVAFATSCSMENQNESVPENNAPEMETEVANDTSAPDYQWVQLGVDSAVIVRAVYGESGKACPEIEEVKADGSKSNQKMTDRGQNMPEGKKKDFEITVCEATLSDDLKSASLGKTALKLPTKSPKRTIIVGDTGCRVKGNDIQNCNDDPSVSGDDEWLFTKTIASATKLDNPQPDLVIHVGDYIYRESPCPESAKEKCCPKNKDGNYECSKSIYGKNWETWKTDFFEPAKPLLEKVPWVFARGNHEDCSREWLGYYLFLDPRPLTDNSLTNCNSHSDPFKVNFDDLSLLVLDSSDENPPTKKDIDQFKGSMPTWIVTHVPFFKPAPYGAESPGSDVEDAIKNKDSKISFLVSGHVHLFEWIEFTCDPPSDSPESAKKYVESYCKDHSNEPPPPQIIAGGGATELDKKVKDFEFKNGLKKIGADTKGSEILHKFTFAYLDNETDKYKVTVIDQDGTTEKRTFTVSK